MANIGINITENGTTTLATAGKYCDRNIDVVVEVEGSGGIVSDDILILTGDCGYKFYNSAWDDFLNTYGDKMSSVDITSSSNMFASSWVKKIPFVLNYYSAGDSSIVAISTCNQATALEEFAGIDGNSTPLNCSNFFNNCSKLKTIGTFKNFAPHSVRGMFSGCSRLRNLPVFENIDGSRLTGASDFSSWFMSCYSLRQIPEDFIKQFVGVWTGSSYGSTIYHQMAQECLALDELRGIPVSTGAIKAGNMFNKTVSYCCRLQNFIFDTQEGGTPYTAQWAAQTIDLSDLTGWAKGVRSYILNYNSGITADKEVSDDATYQALKNDEDWFTCDVNYSRYNHNSAVATINSLPDTSAFLSTNGGTNTIKFKGAAGTNTDGGAINTLTDEEIAVAAAKGWTVSLV